MLRPNQIKPSYKGVVSNILPPHVYHPFIDSATDAGVTVRMTYHPMRFHYLPIKRQAYIEPGWLAKRANWKDKNGVEHVVRWRVDHVTAVHDR